MTAFRIIEHLDVVEDVLHGFIPGCIGLALDTLTLQQLEEALNNSIVVTVSTPPHAWRQPMRRQEIVPVLGGEREGTTHKNLWDELPSSCTSASPEIRPALPE